MSKNFLLFDCDGVLVDSEFLASTVLAEMLHVYGCPTSAEEIMTQYVGQKDVEIIRILSEKHSLVIPPNFIDLFASRLDLKLENELKAIEGIDKTLELLTLPRAIVSNSTLPRIKTSLKSTGLAKYFDENIIFSPDTAQYSKPDPRIYLFALEKLGLEKHTVLVVEDSPTGVSAASEAGLDVIGFLGATHTGGNNQAEVLISKGAKYIAHNSLELSQLINEICG